MKKLVKLVIMVAGVLVLLGSAAFMVTSNSSGVVAQIIDKLTPLVNESSAYVKTGVEPISRDDHDMPTYRFETIDHTGDSLTLDVMGMKDFLPDHYLKITHKGRFVVTYEEVSLSEIPTSLRTRVAQM